MPYQIHSHGKSTCSSNNEAETGPNNSNSNQLTQETLIQSNRNNSKQNRFIQLYNYFYKIYRKQFSSSDQNSNQITNNDSTQSSSALDLNSSKKSFKMPRSSKNQDSDFVKLNLQLKNLHKYLDNSRLDSLVSFKKEILLLESLKQNFPQLNTLNDSIDTLNGKIDYYYKFYNKARQAHTDNSIYPYFVEQRRALFSAICSEFKSISDTFKSIEEISKNTFPTSVSANNDTSLSEVFFDQDTVTKSTEVDPILDVFKQISQESYLELTDRFISELMMYKRLFNIREGCRLQTELLSLYKSRLLTVQNRQYSNFAEDVKKLLMEKLELMKNFGLAFKKDSDLLDRISKYIKLVDQKNMLNEIKTSFENNKQFDDLTSSVGWLILCKAVADTIRYVRVLSKELHRIDQEIELLKNEHNSKSHDSFPTLENCIENLDELKKIVFLASRSVNLVNSKHDFNIKIYQEETNLDNEFKQCDIISLMNNVNILIVMEDLINSLVDGSQVTKVRISDKNLIFRIFNQIIQRDKFFNDQLLLQHLVSYLRDTESQSTVVLLSSLVKSTKNKLEVIGERIKNIKF